MTRRSALRMFAGAGLALAAVGSSGSWASAQAVQQYKTTTALNFRSGPGTSYKVIGVIPAGGIVAHTGKVQNGFYEVGYGGTYGWVHKDYIVPVGSNSPAPSITGVGWTTARVNLRSGAGTSYGVLLVVPLAAKIGTSTTVKNGFRYVSYGGRGGWMSDAFITARNPDDQGGNSMTTTANLNLRAEPSLSAKILTVIPAGKQVQVLHTQAGQFVNVNYGGHQGWVALAYLK